LRQSVLRARPDRFLFKRKDLMQHPLGNSHTTRRSATACNTEGTAVSEITTIMRMLDRIAVGRLMRDVGTMGMGRAESALLALFLGLLLLIAD
jgi:hypothetical protein